METENPQLPSFAYDYDDEITRMMQEREVPRNDNAQIVRLDHRRQLP